MIQFSIFIAARNRGMDYADDLLMLRTESKMKCTLCRRMFNNRSSKGRHNRTKHKNVQNIDISAEDIFDEIFMDITLAIMKEPYNSEHVSFNTATIPKVTVEKCNTPPHTKATTPGYSPIASTSNQQSNNELLEDLDEASLGGELGDNGNIVEQLATASDNHITNAETKWVKLTDECNTRQFHYMYSLFNFLFCFYLVKKQISHDFGVIRSAVVNERDGLREILKNTLNENHNLKTELNGAKERIYDLNAEVFNLRQEIDDLRKAQHSNFQQILMNNPEFDGKIVFLFS